MWYKEIIIFCYISLNDISAIKHFFRGKATIHPAQTDRQTDSCVVVSVI